MAKNSKEPKPIVLVILDGWGLAPPGPGNAVTLAKTPVVDSVYKKYPHTRLIAHGRRVGLPPSQDGNSEAGHMNLGAGRIAEQDSVVISKSINQGTFFKNTAFQQALNHLKNNRANLHLMGLLTSEQSAHADPDHLIALLTFLRLQKIKKVFLHLFTDGRDSPPFQAIELLRRLKSTFSKGEIVCSIMGRFYAMDRKKIWARTAKAYNAMVLGEGEKAVDPEEAVIRSYNRGEKDEFILPTVIFRGQGPRGIISHNDAVIFFNLRSDRARQLAKPFVQKEFEKKGGFKRQKILKNLFFVAMTDFGPDLDSIITAFPSPDLEDTLPQALKDLRQLYIAEQEKYAHITYFFNGGYADPIAGEKRLMIPSVNVSSYDQKPQMSAYAITLALEEVIQKDSFDFITVNFANPDMVGHTGNLEAGIAACEHVDNCLGKLLKLVKEKDGVMIITADHGNIEEMINIKTGEIDTKHSINPVPFIVASSDPKSKRMRPGILADVAPTILKLMGRKKPQKMRGRSLI